MSSIPKAEEANSTDDWQSQRTFADTNLHMLENEILCDVTFKAGENQAEIKAHKFILVSRSRVFQSMFCGPLAESDEPIVVPDIDGDIFKMLFRFLYSEQIQLTDDNVIALLYSAKKYCVTSLVEKCCAFLQTGISTENVCTILEQAQLFDETKLQDRCFDMIFSHSEEVFKSSDFVNLCFQRVKSVLESPRLQIGEELIYSSCVKWSEEECRRQHLDVEDENKRNVLGDILFLIRFPIMSPLFFTETVSTANILTADEKVAIYQQYTVKSGAFTEACKFTNKSRINTNISSIRRFPDVAGSKFDFWVNDNTVDAISFSCTRDITLIGLLMFRPYEEGTAHGSVSVYDEHNALIARRSSIEVDYEHNAQTKDVKLRPALKLSKNKWYTIAQQMMGANTHLGQNGTKQVTEPTVVVTFRKSPMDRNDTNVTSGQIPGFLYM